MKAKVSQVILLSVLVLAGVELLSYAFFCWSRPKLIFSGISPFLPTRKFLARAHHSFDKTLGWNYYPKDRPRPFDHSAPLLSVFGDSFAHGDEVSHAETWEVLLGQALQRDVFNYGVGGYGTDQALLKFRQVVKEQSAPLVLLEFLPENINRVVNSYHPFYNPESGAYFAKPRFHLEKNSLVLDPNPSEKPSDISDPELLALLSEKDYWYLARKSQAISWGFPFSAKLFSPNFRHQMTRIARRTTPVADDYLWETKELRDLMFAIFTAFQREAKALGKTPILAAMGYQGDVEFYQKTGAHPALDLVEEFAAKENLLFFNAVRVLAQNPGPLKSQFRISHLSPAGNATVARGLNDFLQKHNLITDPPL